MPMILDQPGDMSNMRPEGQPQDPLTSYGHPKQHATKCGHALHPSAPQHMPLCPACIASRTKSRMNAALKGLIAEGGLIPADYFRDRKWQRAKLCYEIAKKRQENVRSRHQLREEREQVWEEAHQRFDSQRLQATAAFQHPAECPVCASMMAYFPTRVPKVQAAQDITWWEKPGGLVPDHILVPRTPLRPVKPARQDIYSTKGSSALCVMIQGIRRAMAASDAQRNAWETRYRTESAVRRKHSLGESYSFDPEFWDAPISAFLSRQNYQYVKDTQRMAERRARGNTTRPKPPRSSLSYSKHTNEVMIDKNLLEEIIQKEELEKLERQARRVGEEVGYLYFVGEIDGLQEWREDFLRSDRQIIYREAITESVHQEIESKPEEDDEEDEDEEDETEEVKSAMMRWK